MSDTKQKILEFLKTHSDCVLATTNLRGLPEAATVGFSESQDLELVFGTSQNTRKFANIAHEPHVAVVVGFSGDTTVQYEGIASLLMEPELSQRLKRHFEKIPEVEQYRNSPRQVYLKIKPIWIRYTNYADQPAVEELVEF